MNRFTKSLRFKVTLLVIAVEILILAGFGIYYTHRFSQEVDNAIIARLSIPSLLMSRGELSFDAVNDHHTMGRLLRAPYNKGLVVGLNGIVYFSSDPALFDKHLDEVNGMRFPDPSIASADDPILIAPFQDSTGTYLTSLSPLYPDGKLTGYLYLKVGTAVSETEKQNIAILFAVGSLGTVLLTAAILSWLLNLAVIKRLNNLVGVFHRFSQGDYAVRAQADENNDEIVTLMDGFNGLAQRLEDTLAHLKNSETLLNNTQRLSKVGGWEIDVRSGEVFWTDELYHIHDLPIDTSIDHVKESANCYSPKDREIISEAFQRACEQGESYDFELPFTTRKGKSLWIRTTAQPVYEGDKVIRVVGNLMDITDRHQAEQAQRLSSERLQLATRAARIGIWDWDVLGNELLWDDSMYQLYGIRQEDFGGAYDAWIRTLHPEDRDYTDGEIHAALSGDHEYAPEFRIIRPDGSIRYIKAESKTIQDRDGKPIRMIGTNIDITERKQAEEALRASEQKFRAIFEQTYQFIGLLSVEGTVLAANRTALEFAGVKQQDVIGKAFWDTPWWNHSTEMRQKLQLAVRDAAHGNLVRFEASHPAADGSLHYVDFSLKPVTDSSGHVIQLLPEGRDITDRKKAEEVLRHYNDSLEETVQERTTELLQARNAAEAANRAKSEFLANMSHELRTPLNAILGFSGLMRNDPELTNIQRDNLAIINRSGEHLLNLINDVLEVAKIESGRLQLEIASFDLGNLVRDVTEMMRIRAQEKGLTLVIDQSSEFPRYIKSDEARIRQIIINLIGNAVKFTEQGGVTLRLGVKNNARHHLLIEVEDTGPGIAPEDQQRLFEPFVQLAEYKTQHGTGLGLTITRQFVQMLGGNITIDSSLGNGALFRVDLPVELAEPKDIVVPEFNKHGKVIGLAPGQPPYRILIVEDQRENQLLLYKLMTDLGLDVKTVVNGQECLDIFPDWHPDLIWMDRRMPVMDGVEATKRLRQMPGGETVKIVAVTASALKEQQQKILDAGMDDFIGKPYRFDEIYDCLARQLGVKYVYHADEEDTQRKPVLALTPDMLTHLPSSLRHQLKEVLESLERERILETVQQIGKVDAVLGKTLSRLVGEFNYPAILDALDSISDETAD